MKPLLLAIVSACGFCGLAAVALLTPPERVVPGVALVVGCVYAACRAVAAWQGARR